MSNVSRVIIICCGIFLVCGCMSPREKLRLEVQQIHKQGASDDNTVRVLVVLSTENKPIRALTVLNEPKNRYLATCRFVMAVVKGNEVTLYHRGITRRYPIKERIDTPVFNMYSGSLEYGYYKGDADNLIKALTGKEYIFHEVLVVCDLELNPIELEENIGIGKYPILIEKYGKISQQEYEEWLSTSAYHDNRQ